MRALPALLLALAACAPAAPRPDVLLVVIDTWRWDAFGLHGGNPRDLTPELDAAAERGLIFTRAFGPSPWTLPSVASLLTGRHPTVHGAHGLLTDVAPIHPGIATAAELLRASGYRTRAVVNGPFLAPVLGLARGFEVYDFESSGNRSGRRAEASVDAALAQLGAAGDAPLLLLLHLFDPHLDYDPPPPFLGRWSDGQPARLRAPFGDIRAIRAGRFDPPPGDAAFVRRLYDEEIAASDAALGRFLRVSAELRPGRERLVVVTADHGEEFGEHGGWEHGHTMHAEQLRVPLIVLPPASLGVAPRRVDAQVRLLDVLPTLLAVAGIEPAPELPGRSLFELAQPPPAVAADRIAYAERVHLGRPAAALRDGRFALIRHLDDGSSLLYDQRADPAETRDLAAEYPERVRELTARLDEIRRDLERLAAQRGAAPAPAPLDPEQAEHLRQLGYAESAGPDDGG